MKETIIFDIALFCSVFGILHVDAAYVYFKLRESIESHENSNIKIEHAKKYYAKKYHIHINTAQILLIVAIICWGLLYYLNQ